ncbi:hypothetical protein BJX99DRAFT_194771 [Aspergillus californicus]
MPPGSGQTQSADQGRKRPRPVISCLRCREKKLKCDRVSPCENCAKVSADCVFQPGSGVPSKRLRLAVPSQGSSGDQGNAESSGGGGGIGIIEDLQQRLKRVEQLLGIRTDVHLSLSSNTDGLGLSEGNRNDQPVAEGEGEAEDATPYEGTLVVKGTRTRYHGQNNRITLLNRFASAKEMIRGCEYNSSLFRLAKEVQFLQRKSKLPIDSPESSTSEIESVEIQQMHASLPPLEVCHGLVGLYTQNFENVFRILHVPTLERQCTEFWNSNHSQDHVSLFVPQLTAVLCVAMPLVNESFIRDHPDIHEYLQGPALSLLRAWLQKLTRKQRTEFPNLQTEALVILARQVRLESPEEIWRATGSLVRSAMVVGLHLDISANVDLSLFRKEARKRLWLSIVEMDLQASIASGMPVAIPNADFEFLTPAHIDDDEFDRWLPGGTLPLDKPSDELSDASIQIALAHSLRQRIRAVSLAQRAKPNTDHAEALEQAREIEDYIRNIPEGLRLDQSLELTPGEEPSHSQQLGRVLLDLYIRRPLICLYRVIDREVSRHEKNSGFLDSLLSVLAYQDVLNAATPDAYESSPAPAWTLFHILCKNDILQASLNICDHLQRKHNRSQASHTRQDLINSVERSLDAIIHTITLPGSNMKDIVLLSAVLQSIQADGSGSKKNQDAIMQQGAINALSACRQHLLASSARGMIPDANHAELSPMDQASNSEALFAPSAGGGYTATPLPELAGLFGGDSALAAEFNTFMDNSFEFDDAFFGSFF